MDVCEDCMFGWIFMCRDDIIIINISNDKRFMGDMF